MDFVKIVFGNLGTENFAKNKLIGITTKVGMSNTKNTVATGFLTSSIWSENLLCIWNTADRFDIAMFDF